jgi:hypothetical protein
MLRERNRELLAELKHAWDNSHQRDGMSSRAGKNGREAKEPQGSSKTPEIAQRSAPKEEDSHEKYSALASAAISIIFLFIKNYLIIDLTHCELSSFLFDLWTRTQSHNKARKEIKDVTTIRRRAWLTSIIKKESSEFSPEVAMSPG